ncbi:uncharacterized protein [Nicotiana sylvestris]|uniref:uncharacterized protein n=1 Tax=Nicotiana sylvestris TaxID=4096 RepID=UPI00388C366F
MAQSDDGEDDEVYFRDVQRNLKSYSSKKLMSLANVLIDAYHNLVEDKDALILELGEAEQTRDDLVVCVVDLKETICELKKEEDALTKRITNLEHERDDLVVVVFDHKETIENFSREKEALVKRVTEIEEERDDLLIVVADLRETMEGLEIESKPENTIKGKEVASEEHIRFENELKSGTVKGSSQQWFMDSGCSKHMTGNTMDFISLKVLQGGSVSFGNGKKGYILGVGKRYKNIYVADFESLKSGDLSCLKAIDNDVELWHRRLGHASFSLLNKLIQKDLVYDMPMSKFKVQKVCDACARGKHVKSSFKYKRDVSTSKPLELLHMDLCGPMRVQSRGEKKYIFVIVDDYSRFTWTLFLITKDETFEVFVAFVKKI